MLGTHSEKKSNGWERALSAQFILAFRVPPLEGGAAVDPAADNLPDHKKAPEFGAGRQRCHLKLSVLLALDVPTNHGAEGEQS